ncbi:MAG: TolC family protein, partial [Planctomycetes bacterium]|nr:TolC family protein [Planctomycetota bacterium]
MPKPLLLVTVSSFLAALVAGCVPSDAEIASELDASRRAAYYEWKSLRDSGRSREPIIEGPLSLEDAVKLALQHNKALQSIVTEREVVRGERLAAYSVVLPSVTLSGGATRYERHRERSSDIDSYAVGLTVTQPIMQGDAIPARLRQARFYTALADEVIREAVQLLIQDVANNYYDVLLAQHLIETQREALVSAEAQYRMVTERKRQETATDYDVLRAQVDVATYRARMISQQNAVDTNRVQLLKNMGVSQDSDITFSDKLEFLPMRPVFERAVEIASGNRPDIRQAELETRIYAEAVRIARSAYWPAVSATFDQGWSDGYGIHDTFARNPWSAGIGASWYFGIDNRGNLDAAKARERQRYLELLDIQEDALRQIRQEMNNLANAEEMIKALVVNQDAASEALRLVLVGYQAGVNTEVDVTDARKALTEVQGEYYTSLADHTKARLNLQVAMGVLGPTCVTDGPPTPPRVPIANIEEFAATDYVPPTPIPMPSADDVAPISRSRSRRSEPGASSRSSATTTTRSARPSANSSSVTPTRATGSTARAASRSEEARPAAERPERTSAPATPVVPPAPEAPVPDVSSLVVPASPVAAVAPSPAPAPATA